MHLIKTITTTMAAIAIFIASNANAQENAAQHNCIEGLKKIFNETKVSKYNPDVTWKTEITIISISNKHGPEDSSEGLFDGAHYFDIEYRIDNFKNNVLFNYDIRATSSCIVNNNDKVVAYESEAVYNTGPKSKDILKFTKPPGWLQ